MHLIWLLICIIFLQDFVHELLVMLDIFIPIKHVMEAVQSCTVAGWKIVIYLEALLAHLERLHIVDQVNTPLLRKHLQDVKELRFKGM